MKKAYRRTFHTGTPGRLLYVRQMSVLTFQGSAFTPRDTKVPAPTRFAVLLEKEGDPYTRNNSVWI
jgi:hypothetical protein